MTAAGARDSPPRRPTGQAGSATVWVLALAVLLTATSGLVLVVGSVSVARHRAAVAADQAALAAAAALARGDPGPCRAAARLSDANRAELVACGVRSRGVVEVAVRLPRVLPWPGSDVVVRARAGPAG